MADASLPDNSLALRDIHLPDPISWWPPAPGWWALLIIMTLAVISFFIIRRIQRSKRIRKEALAEFETIRDKYQNNLNTGQLVRSISVLLRRVCLSYYPQTNVHGMTGNQWLHYLDSTAETKGFQSDSGNILATAPYQPKHKRLDFDPEALLALCEAWIKAQPRKEMQS